MTVLRSGWRGPSRRLLHGSLPIGTPKSTTTMSPAIMLHGLFVARPGANRFLHPLIRRQPVHHPSAAGARPSEAVSLPARWSARFPPPDSSANRLWPKKTDRCCSMHPHEYAQGLPTVSSRDRNHHTIHSMYCSRSDASAGKFLDLTVILSNRPVSLNRLPQSSAFLIKLRCNSSVGGSGYSRSSCSYVSK